MKLFSFSVCSIGSSVLQSVMVACLKNVACLLRVFYKCGIILLLLLLLLLFIMIICNIFFIFFYLYFMCVKHVNHNIIQNEYLSSQSQAWDQCISLKIYFLFIVHMPCIYMYTLYVFIYICGYHLLCFKTNCPRILNKFLFPKKNKKFK